MGILTNSARLIDKIKNIKATGVETTQPSNPTAGSTYYDATNNILMVYDGTQWNAVGGGSKTGYIDLLVIGGGGSGGVSSTINCYAQGGGGGAGGYFEDFGFTLYGGETYSIKIGAGGASSTCGGNNGGDTYFRNSLQTINICMCGGGGGGYYNYGKGGDGGSGGGAGYNGSVGSGICGQGHNGNGANGGGAGENSCGCYSSISGSCIAYAGGGMGISKCGSGGVSNTDYGCLGWCGCGGGSGGTIGTPKEGRNGVVILRYKTDGSYGILPTSIGGIKYTCGDYTIHCFTDTTTAQCFVPVFK